MMKSRAGLAGVNNRNCGLLRVFAALCAATAVCHSCSFMLSQLTLQRTATSMSEGEACAHYLKAGMHSNLNVIQLSKVNNKQKKSDSREAKL